MCIPESTAHLSFHGHSIPTPMTGIPELTPPKKNSEPKPVHLLYAQSHKVLPNTLFPYSWISSFVFSPWHNPNKFGFCSYGLTKTFYYIHGWMLSVADDEPRKKVDAHQEKHRTLRGSLQNDGVSP